ncbi:hypothetical protein BDY21DRAFT_88692 [Lineolata rhizophorae]|uniref:Uncharacterized protein n=1 Tax=Lineolata rhizophorae TaxID=578093 RepID=A0A6A6PC94_9PEZI|nr:hypothetical protein BDY21DRAFT_88692 [Lineolata rhizophorae]
MHALLRTFPRCPTSLLSERNHSSELALHAFTPYFAYLTHCKPVRTAVAANHHFTFSCWPSPDAKPTQTPILISRSTVHSPPTADAAAAVQLIPPPLLPVNPMANAHCLLFKHPGPPKTKGAIPLAKTWFILITATPLRPMCVAEPTGAAQRRMQGGRAD